MGGALLKLSGGQGVASQGRRSVGPAVVGDPGRTSERLKVVTLATNQTVRNSKLTKSTEPWTGLSCAALVCLVCSARLVC